MRNTLSRECRARASDGKGNGFDVLWMSRRPGLGSKAKVSTHDLFSRPSGLGRVDCSRRFETCDLERFIRIMALSLMAADPRIGRIS